MPPLQAAPLRRPLARPGWRGLAAALLAFAFASPGEAQAPGPRVLRVGTSGDYAPFSSSGPGDTPAGFDVAVARAYAQERGLTLEFVRFRWPELVRDLAAGRFDVAMSGVSVRPQRSLAGRFSVPVVENGAVLLLREAGRFESVEAFDRPDLRIGVNKGGHLEQVAEAHFRRATLIAIADNAAVREALLAGELDAAVTDSLEAPQWRRGAEELEQTPTFTRDRKAYLVRADSPALAADLDRWLLAAEADGSLPALRSKHLGEAGETRTATPLAALVAAMDERLALMPFVAAAKRQAGLPLEAPEREAVVLEAAVATAREAAARAGVTPLPEAAVRAVFAAQLDAAKQIQANALRDPRFKLEPPIPDLDGELRPALLRIGEQIGALLVALPPDLDAAAIQPALRDGLRTPRLSPDAVARIAEALVELAQARAATPAPRPPESGGGAAASGA
jgi:cyclohexadienyl dehydratase